MSLKISKTSQVQAESEVFPNLSQESKETKLSEAMKIGASLNKTHDTVLLTKLGKTKPLPIPSIPTGLPSIDNVVIGCGGIPRGRITEIFGPESSGKTSLALHVIGQAQRMGLTAAFVDAEHALDLIQAARLGVDTSELLVSQPDYGEQALEVVDALVGVVDVIVVDSVSALVPKAELDGEYGESHMGLQARLMSQAMRKLVGKVNKSGTAVIFINQIREKVGVTFCNPEVTSGGRALKFYASLRLEVRRMSNTDGGPIKEGDVHVGHKMWIDAKKNKVGAPFNKRYAELRYATGFNARADMFMYALEIGAVTETGKGWYYALCLPSDQKVREGDLTADPLYAKLVESVISKQAGVNQ